MNDKTKSSSGAAPQAEVRQNKKPKQESTRDGLLRVMVQTLDEHGEAGVRLEKILRDAKASVSSMYHYFGNLAGFIEAAQLVRFRRLQLLDLHHLKEGIESTSTPSEFRELIKATMKRTFQRDRQIVRAQGVNAVARSYQNPEYEAHIRATQSEANQALANELRRAQEKGLISSHVDVEAAAVWWTSTLFSRYFVEMLNEPGVEERWDHLTQRLALSILEMTD